MKRIALSMAALGGLAFAQTMKAPDITKNPTLYVVPYAHLDTQWRWEFPQTISEYLLKTMRVNFDLMDKYPHYVFNWTGANRYRLMKEYFPSDYAKLKQYVAKGQWYPAGSSMEEGDVNLPNAEGIIRQILYGNTYFRKEFGKASAEYMLPDCFGFPASLPSILAHAGVKGFSTQKLSSGWQPAPQVGGPNSPEQTPEGIPFNVGIWEGTDGKTIIAALNPGGYGSNVTTDLSKEPPPPPPPGPNGRGGRGGETDWVKRIDIDGKLTGVYADYQYVGTGDIGGATGEETAKLLEATVTKGMAVLPVPGAGRGGRGGQPATPPPPARTARRDGRRSRARRRSHGGPDVPRHQAGDDNEHAALQGRSGTHQSLRRLADFGGLSQALEPEERSPGRRRGEGLRRRQLARRPALSAGAPQRCLDARHGRPFPRQRRGHGHAALLRVHLE